MHTHTHLLSLPLFLSVLLSSPTLKVELEQNVNKWVICCEWWESLGIEKDQMMGGVGGQQRGFFFQSLEESQTVIFTMHLAITEILHWHLALSGSFFLFLWHSFAATLYAALLKKEVLSLTINVWLYITVLFAYEFEVHWNKQIPSLIHCKSAETFKIYTKFNWKVFSDWHLACEGG